MDEADTFYTCLLRTLVAIATFFIVAIPGQYSGERLQDHWSSCSKITCIDEVFIRIRIKADFFFKALFCMKCSRVK